MDVAGVLAEAYSRIGDEVRGAVDGLTADELAHRIEPGTNSIGWLVWHLTRVQDDHVADVAGIEQVWTAQGWARRFGLELPDSDTGYGHTPEQVAAVRVASPDLLVGYYDAVAAQTLAFVRDLSGTDLDRVVDTNWTPHVTLGVRLVSVIDDDVAHAGQALLLRGILGRTR